MKRPSDQRREKLLKKEPSNLKNLHNNLLPIERYYDIADKLFKMFEDAHQAGNIDQAYVFGKRVSVFCAELLPTHPYYKSSRNDLKLLRRSNIQNIDNVVTTLELIVEIMDEEEVQREEEERKRRIEMEKAARENLLQRTRNLEMNNHQGEEKESVSQEELQMSAEEKLRLLLRGPDEEETKPEEASDPIKPEEENKADEKSWSDVTPLPTPLPPPTGSINKNDSSPWNPVVSPEHTSPTISPPPPSYDSVVSHNDSNDVTPSMNPQFNGSGSWLHESNPKLNDAKKPPSPEDSAVPIRQLRQIYRKELDALKQQKKVEIFYLSTYQGRARTFGKDSTNGCTVISPLIATQYLNNTLPGMSDDTIEEVIDVKAPPILNALRRKLGLSGDALIIPSDAHDYLVDLKLLKQDMFVDVSGGNILDPNHLMIFLNMLKNGTTTKENEEEKKSSSKKVAAALFFHEHVVSILKINWPNGDAWYDLVDSMPKSKEGGRGMGCTRTRCKDLHSLEAVLRSYACSKFTDSNCMYIDNNVWDDVLCDFDPRVFQAFVWAT